MTKQPHLKKPWKPVELSDIELSFPATVAHLMPARNDIPLGFDYHYFPRNEWVEYASKLFFEGTRDHGLIPKEGIDPSHAHRHIMAVARSFEPKHERKIESIGTLFAAWFEAVVDAEGKVVVGTVPENLVLPTAEEAKDL